MSISAPVYAGRQPTNLFTIISPVVYTVPYMDKVLGEYLLNK